MKFSGKMCLMIILKFTKNQDFTRLFEKTKGGGERRDRGWSVSLYRVKGYANCYNVNFLNSFNSELELKDTESAIKNKLKKLLAELKEFKFVTALTLVLKKIESD